MNKRMKKIKNLITDEEIKERISLRIAEYEKEGKEITKEVQDRIVMEVSLAIVQDYLLKRNNFENRKGENENDKD